MKQTLLIINRIAAPINDKSLTLEFKSSLKPLSRIRSLFRSIEIRLFPSHIKRYLDLNISKNLEGYDMVILFDSMGQSYTADAINKSGFGGRKIFYYWNPCKNEGKLPAPFEGWEIWTFDSGDSEKYGFKYGGQFIDDRDFKSVGVDKEEYDIYFCGINKGRFKSLFTLKKTIDNNLRVHFRFVDPIRSLISRKYSPKITYSRYLEEESKARALVEYYQNNQIGLTLRSVESLILQKKLITNNPEIRKYPFYRSENILVSENPEVEEIKSFLDRPFIRYTESEIKPYLITSWAERIINNTEFSDYVD